MEENELKELIQSETYELAKSQFMNGVLAGWNACLYNIKSEISGINSSKKIKKLIDEKIRESKERLLNSEGENKSDN